MNISMQLFIKNTCFFLCITLLTLYPTLPLYSFLSLSRDFSSNIESTTKMEKKVHQHKIAFFEASTALYDELLRRSSTKGQDIVSAFLYDLKKLKSSFFLRNKNREAAISQLIEEYRKELVHHVNSPETLNNFLQAAYALSIVPQKGIIKKVTEPITTFISPKNITLLILLLLTLKKGSFLRNFITSNGSSFMSDLLKEPLKSVKKTVHDTVKDVKEQTQGIALSAIMPSSWSKPAKTS